MLYFIFFCVFIIIALIIFIIRKSRQLKDIRRDHCNLKRLYFLNRLSEAYQDEKRLKNEQVNGEKRS